MSEVIALIPARIGSKSVELKNVQSVRGVPLIEYSIRFAVEAMEEGLVQEVWCSTDSEILGEFASRCGVQVHLRAPGCSNDLSNDLSVFRDFLSAYPGEKPKYIVHLRPTAPVRKIDDLREMLQRIKENPSATSIRSLSESLQTPYKMWEVADKTTCGISPLLDGIEDLHSAPRQVLPKVYMQNANIDIVKTTTLEKGSVAGENVLGYIQEQLPDIDTYQDLKQAIMMMATQDARTICFDIDGVIASLAPGNNYRKALPLKRNIDVVNRLHEKGYAIILYTARGSKTGEDWETVTYDQMDEWEVQYDEIHFGKPAASFYVDDRMISMYEISKFEERGVL
jgi:CMP-N,N'-diacetyllegionaminic acid synthase